MPVEVDSSVLCAWHQQSITGDTVGGACGVRRAHFSVLMKGNKGGDEPPGTFRDIHSLRALAQTD